MTTKRDPSAGQVPTVPTTSHTQAVAQVQRVQVVHQHTTLADTTPRQA